MKLGGLFSGVGGFELAWTQLGHEVAWMCEVDKSARKVLEARFPGVPIYPDVRDLDPAEVEAVDVLTGGSPCQGFSVAGNRSGLEHSESQLFRDYIRIMDGLAERGLQYAVWENVPGVLSITNDDGERTFEHVVTALAGGTEPVRFPADKRWNTGLASGRGRAVAWRVLDSRYFGVAQRRRRIFACVAFGDSCEDRAGRTLLAVSEGVRGDSSSSVEAREEVAGGVGGRAGVPRIAGTISPGAHPGSYNGQDAFNDLLFTDSPLVPELAGALGAQQRGGQDIDGTTYFPDLPDVARTLKARADGSFTADGHGNEVVVDHPSFGMHGASGNEGAIHELQPAVTASHGQPGNVAVPAMLLQMRDGKPGGGKGPLVAEEESATLKAANHQMLFQPQDGISYDGMNQKLEFGVHRSLRIGRDSSDFVVQPQAFRKAARARSTEDSESWVEDGQANTLNVFDVGDTRTTHAIVEPPAYGVRRLTPVECERLQSFPDGWTEPAGSDSARYKAMGNAVTVNVVRWILGRMVNLA